MKKKIRKIRILDLWLYSAACSGTKLPVVGKDLLQGSKAVHEIILVEAAACVLVQIGTRRKHVPRAADSPVQTVNDRRLTVAQQYRRLLTLTKRPTMSPHRSCAGRAGRQPAVDGRVVESRRVSSIYILATEDQMITQRKTAVFRLRLNLPIDACNRQQSKCIRHMTLMSSFSLLEGWLVGI